MTTGPRLSYGFDEAVIKQILNRRDESPLCESLRIDPYPNHCSRRRRFEYLQRLGRIARGFRFKCQIFDRPEKFLLHIQRRFDCLITDLNMKGMSGLELQEKLSAADPDLPIIFMSAQLAPEAKARALRLGAVAFLNKPINDDVLHRHIISALNRGSMDEPDDLPREP